MLPSSYLKQSDFNEDGFIVTVKHIKHENLAKENEPTEMKFVLFFAEFEKGLVLNSTNITSLAKACNSDNTDEWLGQEVIVYVDANVNYGGKTTGGLRIKRHASAQPKAAPSSQSRG